MKTAIEARRRIAGIGKNVTSMPVQVAGRQLKLAHTRNGQVGLLVFEDRIRQKLREVRSKVPKSIVSRECENR